MTEPPFFGYCKQGSAHHPQPGNAMKKRETILLFLLLALVNCSNPADTETTEAEDRTQLQEMFDEIDLLIGDPVCSDVGQCRLVGIGAKPCGGVWSYLPYSIVVTDSVQLAQQVIEYNQFEADMNSRFGLISTCDITPIPTLACVEDRCVVVGQP